MAQTIKKILVMVLYALSAIVFISGTVVLIAGEVSALVRLWALGVTVIGYLSCAWCLAIFNKLKEQKND